MGGQLGPQLVWMLWSREKNILPLLIWFFSPYLSQEVEVVENEVPQIETFMVMTPCNSMGSKRRKIRLQIRGDITDKTAVWKLQISTRYLKAQ
jgi:hypothetical protein